MDTENNAKYTFSVRCCLDQSIYYGTFISNGDCMQKYTDILASFCGAYRLSLGTFAVPKNNLIKLLQCFLNIKKNVTGETKILVQLSSTPPFDDSLLMENNDQYFDIIRNILSKTANKYPESYEISAYNPDDFYTKMLEVDKKIEKQEIDALKVKYPQHTYNNKMYCTQTIPKLTMYRPVADDPVKIPTENPHIFYLGTVVDVEYIDVDNTSCACSMMIKVPKRYNGKLYIEAALKGDKWIINDSDDVVTPQ